MRRPSSEPHDIARRATLEWWFWIGNYPVPLLLFALGLQDVAVMYLGLISVHALVEAAGARREAARARCDAT